MNSGKLLALTCAFLTFAAVSFAESSYGNNDSHECGDECKFSFCYDYHKPSYGLNAFMIGRYSDRPFTPAICDKYGKFVVGVVGSTGEAYVMEDWKKTLISNYSPYGLAQNFSPSFFKTFALDRVQRSGVGHETPQQNQLNYLDNKCIVLPLTAYQKLDKYGHVIDNVHPRGRPFVDCVAFRTTVSKY